MTRNLPEPLLRFIASTIPTYQSAQVLLFLATRPERQWKPEEIVLEIRPVVLTVPAVRKYLALFRMRDILKEYDGSFQYDPSSSGLDKEIAALAHAYNERPVTLIHAIYRMADSAVQSFVDSFDLNNE